MPLAQRSKELKLIENGGSYKKIEESNGSLNEEMLPYRYFDLTPGMLKEARVALHETEETRPKALKELRELIENEPKLVCPTDDKFLLMFLRGRKFDVDRAFKLIQNFWKFRKAHPEIYEAMKHEENVQEVVSLILKNYFGFLPFRDKEGSIVIYINVGKWNPDVDTIERCYQAATGILIHSMKFPVTQIMGYRVIFDARETSWMQLKMASLSNMLMFLHSTQKCFPGRYKSIHVLSDNKLFNFITSIIYPILPSKLRKRVVIHGSDTSCLQEYIHPNALPEELDGNGGPYDNECFRYSLTNEIDDVTYLLKYGYQD